MPHFKSLFLVLVGMISSTAFAQDKPPTPVNLENATFLKAEDEEPSGDQNFGMGSAKELPSKVARFKAVDGKIYSLAFPFGIGQKLMVAYVNSKKTFYVDDGKVSTELNWFLETHSEFIKKYNTREAYELKPEQQTEVLQAMQADKTYGDYATPLRGQPIGMILNFVFEQSQH